MQFTENMKPHTVLHSRVKFTMPDVVVEEIEKLKPSGPAGRWAQAKAGGGWLRIYFPAEVGPGTEVVMSLATHHDQTGREHRRVTIVPAKRANKPAIEARVFEACMAALQFLAPGCRETHERLGKAIVSDDS